MKKINVIDLDKTLIPYDSFRVLIIEEILKFNISIFFIAIARYLRFITLEDCKHKISEKLSKKYHDEFFKGFAAKLYEDIDTKVFDKIKEETDDETLNVLLSASPDIYVKFLIDKLEWVGSGSQLDKNGQFIHLYADKKVDWVERKFDVSKYRYNFAISDSSSDDDLLDIFEKKIKWKPK